MKKLNESQIETIAAFVTKQLTNTNELQQEVIDHICCEIEQRMTNNMSFEEAKEQTLKEVFQSNNHELEKNAIEISKTQGYKKSVKIAGIISIGFASISIVGKLFHLPASNILIITSAVILVLYFLPLLFKYLYSIEKYSLPFAKQKNIWGYIGISILIIGITCKLFHVPATNIMFVIGFFIINIIYLPRIFGKKENM